MAARALALVPLREDEEMARTATDTSTLLTAINESTRQTESAINKVNVGVAELRSDVGHIGKSLDNLSAKVDTIDRDKAARVDLTSAELRFEKTITELRVRTAEELNSKIDASQFSIDAWENFNIRLEEIDKRTTSTENTVNNLEKSINGQDGLAPTVRGLDRFRWKVVGAYGAIALVFTLLGWFLHTR